MAKNNRPDDELIDDIDDLDDLDDEPEALPDAGKETKTAAKGGKHAGGKHADSKYATGDSKAVKIEKKKKDGAGKKLAKWFRDARGEFKKIIWPTRKTVIRNTSVTIAMCALVGLAVSLFDWGLGALIDVFTSNF